MLYFQHAAARRLQLLDAAITLEFLRAPPGNRFGGDAQSWQNLQQAFDLKVAEQELLPATQGKYSRWRKPLERRRHSQA